MAEEDVPLSLTQLPDPLLGQIVEYIDNDALSLLRLSWTCRFWRNRDAQRGDDAWRRLLVGTLDDVDGETCRRLW